MLNFAVCVCVFCQMGGDSAFHVICKAQFAGFSSWPAKMKTTEGTHLGGDDSRAGVCREKAESSRDVEIKTPWREQGNEAPGAAQALLALTSC